MVERSTTDSGDSRDFEAVTDFSELQGEIDSRIAIEIEPIQRAKEEEAAEPEQPISAPLSDGISFYPDGTADGCEISLRDRMGFKLVLQLDPVTAGVHLVNKEEP